jgi:hypothetical protein
MQQSQQQITLTENDFVKLDLLHGIATMEAWMKCIRKSISEYKFAHKFGPKFFRDNEKFGRDFGESELLLKQLNAGSIAMQQLFLLCMRTEQKQLQQQNNNSSSSSSTQTRTRSNSF